MGDITQQTVVWAINGVFAFFVIMGVLFGLARGAKKSVLRFVFIAIIGAGMYFAAPHISSWLLNINLSSLFNGTITIGGSSYTVTTINALLTEIIDSNAALQDFVTANPSFTTIIEQLPGILTNLVIFLGGFWLLKTITWPIYAIAALRYNRRNEDGERPKKHRLGGLLIGGVQGVAIALVTFLPIAGVSGILNVQGTDGSTLLGTLLPEDISPYLSVYEDSAIGMIGGVGGFDDRMFDGLTTMNVPITDGEGNIVEYVKIKPRQEAQTGMEIANDIARIIEMVEAIQNGETEEIDWTLIEGVVDKVFELNTLKVLLEEYAPYLLEQVLENEEYGLSAEIDEEIEALPVADDVRAFLDVFTLSLDETTLGRLKTDVLAIVGVFKALDEHGVLPLVFDMAKEEITEEVFAQSVFEIFGTNRDLSYDIMVATLSSQSLRTLMPAGINIALGYIEYFANEGRAENLAVIDRIDVDSIDWDLEAGYLTDISFNLMAFVYGLDPFNLDDADPLNIITALELTRLGEVVNAIRSSTLYGAVYESIIEAALTMPQVHDMVGEYIDLDGLISLLSTLDWVDEFGTIEDIIDIAVIIADNGEIERTELVNAISKLGTSELLEFALDSTIKYAFVEMLEENIGEEVEGVFVFNPEFTWLDNLNLSAISNNSEFFADLILFAKDLIESGIEELTYEQLDDLAEVVGSLGDTEELTPEELQELEEFKSFFDGLIQYMVSKIDAEEVAYLDGLSIDDLIDNIDTVSTVLALVLAIEDETIFDYTPAQVQELVDELAELNDMSPELVTSLQQLIDDIILETEIPFAIDVASIDFEDESELIGDLLTLYIAYGNNEEESLLETLAENVVNNLTNSYIAEEILNYAVEQMVDGEVPLWVNDVDMTWIANNDGLMVELIQLAMWSQDNELENITQTQIDELQLEVDNIDTLTYPQYTDFALFMQDFVDSLSNAE